MSKVLLDRMTKVAGSVAASVTCLLATPLAYAAPLPEQGWGSPRDASLDGHRIDWLLNVTLGLLTALFIIMTGWLLYAAIVHNTKRHRAKYDHGDSRRSAMVALGMAGGVFLVVDGNLFFNSTADLHNVFENFEKPENDPNTVRIEINAHQWAWDARYAGPDGKFNTKDDIVTLNDIKIPVGAPVILQVGSTDVIHAVYLPNFRIKIDVVPGTINRMWFQAQEVGDFEIGCAQHCGTNHYKMKANLSVLEKGEYAKWAAQASAISARAYDEKDTAAHWGWDWKKE